MLRTGSTSELIRPEILRNSCWLQPVKGKHLRLAERGILGPKGLEFLPRESCRGFTSRLPVTL